MDIPFLPPLEWVARPVAILLVLGFTLFQIAFFAVTAYFLISWPLRRRERTRCLLDLLDSGLQRGHTLSQSLAAPASSGDRTFGYRYRMFAAELAAGATLTDALKHCPSLVHPRVASLLSLGEQTNTLHSMVQVCRHSLQDATARFHASRQYLMSFSILLVPVGLATVVILRLFVLPKFRDISIDMGVQQSPTLQDFQRPSALLSGLEWLMVGVVLVLGISLVAAPWVLRAFRALHAQLTDTALWLMPWHRNRLLRDTTQSLALLIDSGVPESQAVQLAGSHQANLHVLQLTRAAGKRLENGEPLTAALASWDPKGELAWRLTNAQRTPHTRMTEALQGWWSMLDARAFRQEHMAAQILTCSFVLLNGWMVSRIARLVFYPIIDVINATLLW